MKKLFNILIICAMVTATYACNDLLSRTQPSESITQKQTLTTEGGVNAVRASMYNRLISFNYETLYMLGPSARADGLMNRAGASRLTGLIENTVGSGIGSYGTSYDLINDANLLIHAVKKGVVSASTLKQYQGEAYFMRAFAYHHLARDYSYEPDMSPASGPGQGFKMGIVIRNTPTLSVSDANYRPRSSVSKVYSQIIGDLQKSINLLGSNGSATRTFVTKAAAEAEMARVQLYDAGAGSDHLQKANDMAEAAIKDANADGAKLATTKTQVTNMFDETKGLNPEGIFILKINPNTESLGVNNSLTVYTSQQYVAGIPTQDILNLYGKNDYRLAWFGPCFYDQTGKFAPGCRGTNSPYINLPSDATGIELDKWQGNLGQFADNVPYLRIAEMLLIESEARLRGANRDPAAPLNKLRQARGLAPLASVTMQDILNERRREFIGEGQRFWDLKRLGMTIRKAPGSKQFDTSIQDLPYNDFKVLDNIPNNQVSLSEANAPKDSVLIQNPGY